MRANTTDDRYKLRFTKFHLSFTKFVIPVQIIPIETCAVSPVRTSFLYTFYPILLCCSLLGFPTRSTPLSVKSLLSAYHHVDVSSLHDSQPAGVFWDTVTGPQVPPMYLHRGEKTIPVERQTSGTVCTPSWDKNTFQVEHNCEYTILF